MNRKPTSYGDMLKTVAACQHQELSNQLKMVLMALSLWASETGEHAYPGNEALSPGAGLEDKALRNNLKRLQEIGLIKCTVQSKGRGQANEYRFCLENSAYPDDYPGRLPKESRYDKVPPLQTPGPGSRYQEAPKPVPTQPEAGILAAEAGTSVYRPSLPPSTHISQTDTSTTTPGVVCVGAGQWAALNGEEKPAKVKDEPSWVHDIWLDENPDTPLQIQTPHKKKFWELFEKHGEAVLKLAWTKYTKGEPRPYILEPVKVAVKMESKAGKPYVWETEDESSITRNPFAAFVKAPSGCIASAEKELARTK